MLSSLMLTVSVYAGSVRTVSSPRAFDSAIKRGNVIVYFFNPSCPICQGFDAQGTFPQLASQMPKVSFVKVNIKSKAALPLADEYNITATPTFILFSNGNQVDRVEGSLGTAPLQRRIQNAFNL